MTISFLYAAAGMEARRVGTLVRCWRKGAGVSGGLRADEIAPACALHGLIDHRFGLGRCHAVVLELGVHAQAMEEASQALLRAGEVGAEDLLQGPVALPITAPGQA